MTAKSNKRKKEISSSCSSDDSAQDPDYTVSLSDRQLFSSFRSYQSKQTREMQRQRSSKSRTKMNMKFKGNVNSRNENKQEYHKHLLRRNRNVIKNRDGNRTIITSLYSWLIDSDVIEENEKVYYIHKSKNLRVMEGTIKRDGILCCCCNKIFATEAFTSHCGRTSNKPYESIAVVKSNFSMLSYLIEAWNNIEECARRRFNHIEAQGKASDSHDDACMICADGGNLMCCENCCSTYHQSCMNMEVLPRGAWFCPYCVCKFCGNPVLGEDYLIECPQCEKKYHWGCYLARELKTIDLNSKLCAPFCGKGCEKVYEKLERNLIGVRNELGEGFSWTLLHQMDGEYGVYIEETYRRTVCHSKLAVARRLMEDSFEQIFDRHSNINMIPSIVYNCGSNFKRLQFRGFYTAVLEKDDEIISAACLRIHGTMLAEMPFIATSTSHRRKGMCKRLMVAIESALCYLYVQYLVIPSTSERVGHWIDRFGFSPLDPSLKEEITRFNTVMFHDSVRLQKALMSPHVQIKSADTKNEGNCAMLQKATNNSINHSPNWFHYTRKAKMASPFDYDTQAPTLNKKALDEVQYSTCIPLLSRFVNFKPSVFRIKETSRIE